MRKTAAELVIGYEGGKFRDIPALALLNIDRLYDLISAYFYSDGELNERGIKREQVFDR